MPLASKQSTLQLNTSWFTLFFLSFFRKTSLTSVLTLRKRIETKCNTKFREILADSIFVGCVNRQLSLIQYASNLFLCDMQKLRFDYLVS